MRLYRGRDREPFCTASTEEVNARRRETKRSKSSVSGVAVERTVGRHLMHDAETRGEPTLRRCLRNTATLPYPPKQFRRRRGSEECECAEENFYARCSHPLWHARRCKLTDIGKGPSKGHRDAAPGLTCHQPAFVQMPHTAADQIRGARHLQAGTDWRHRLKKTRFHTEGRGQQRLPTGASNRSGVSAFNPPCGPTFEFTRPATAGEASRSRSGATKG